MDDPNVKEITDESLDMVEAEFVNIKQSSVRSVEGGHVELHQVGALSIDGEKIELTKSAAAMVSGSDIYLNQGLSVVTSCNNANFNYAFSPITLSKDSAAVNKSAAGIIAAQEIKAENTSALLLLAKNIEGDVTTLFDWRSALALGAVAGGIWGLFSLFRKR